MKENQENSTKELTVDQLTIAKRIVEEMPEFSLTDVQKIIQREQELTMIAVKKGVKVVKKNYLTIYTNDTKERKIKSPLNGETYTIPAHRAVYVKVGDGFKSMVANKEMPSKICRSISRIPA